MFWKPLFVKLYVVTKINHRVLFPLQNGHGMVNRVDFLNRYVSWPAAELEQTECLEQLRALWHAVPIHVADALEPPPIGVDTPEDLARLRQLLEQK